MNRGRGCALTGIMLFLRLYLSLLNLFASIDPSEVSFLSLVPHLILFARQILVLQLHLAQLLSEQLDGLLRLLQIRVRFPHLGQLHPQRNDFRQHRLRFLHSLGILRLLLWLLLLWRSDGGGLRDLSLLERIVCLDLVLVKLLLCSLIL